MQVQQLVLRQACKAANAYSPSLALRSAFSSTGRSHEHATTSRRAPAAIDRDLQNEQSQLTRVVQSSGVPATNADPKEIGKGGFADYEALRGSFGVRKGGADIREKAPQGRHQNRVYGHFKSLPPRGALTERISRPVRENRDDADALDSTSPEDARSKRSRQRAARAIRDVNRKTGKFWTGSEAWQMQMIDVATRAGELSKQRVKLKDEEAIETGRARLAYEGRYVAASWNAWTQPLPIPWAADAANISDLERMDILEQEIYNFAKYADATPAEQVARQAVVADLETYIKDTLPGVHVTLSGSETTGLATSTSDIDVQLWFNDSPVAKDAMDTLYRAMHQSADYRNLHLRAAKYALVSAKHSITGIDIQIVAAPSTAPQQKLTQQYLQELPYLRSLYLLLRTMLGTRGLIDVFSGGIGSYGLLIMLVASLKRRSSDTPTTAAESLKRFFDFYSTLDVEKYAVSLTPQSAKLFKKHDAWSHPVKANTDAARRRGDDIRAAQWSIGQRRLYQPYLFCLQDPADPLNDLGRKSNAIKHIQATIATLRMVIFPDDKYTIDPSVQERIHTQEESLLLPLVGRCHEIYAGRRERMENYGLTRMNGIEGSEEPALAERVDMQNAREEAAVA